MPPARDDPAEQAASEATRDSYASIWSELSEAQRAAILATISKTEPPPDRSPAVHETIHALRHMHEETAVERPSSEPARAPRRELWAWHPQDNGLLAASFDPALVVGGNAPSRGVLICQRLTVPADAPIQAILLDVVTGGSGLVSGSAAVYEADGTRSGRTHDKATAWSADGLHRMALAEQIRPRPESRSVWVGFVADGAALPGFAVPWVSRAARPNLGLPSPGPQRAGEIAELTTCPERIAPAQMVAGAQYWVGLV